MIQFKVGDGQEKTPSVGSNLYVDPDLKGKFYVVEKAGFGPLFAGIHYMVMYFGGFQLLSDAQFVENEYFTVKIQ